jgi:hypothetical protein
MKTDIHLPSDRSFGWTFTGLFLVIGFFHPWLMALAAVTAAVTLTRAHWLAPLNRAWMKLAEVLHRVVSPLIMGIMFFGLFTPMGYAMRRFGWDAMKRTRDPQAKSYWIRRDPAGPADDSFKNLF